VLAFSTFVLVVPFLCDQKMIYIIRINLQKLSKIKIVDAIGFFTFDQLCGIVKVYIIRKKGKI